MKKYIITGAIFLAAIFVSQQALAQSTVTFQLSLVDAMENGQFNINTDRVEIRGALDGGLSLKNVYTGNFDGDDGNPSHELSDASNLSGTEYAGEEESSPQPQNDRQLEAFSDDQESIAGSTFDKPNVNSNQNTGVRTADNNISQVYGQVQQSPQPSGLKRSRSEGAYALDNAAGGSGTANPDKRKASINRMQSGQNNQQSASGNKNPRDTRSQGMLDASLGSESVAGAVENNPGGTTDEPQVSPTGIIMTEGVVVDSVYNVTITFPSSLMGEVLNFRFAKIVNGQEYIEELEPPRLVTLSPGSRELNVSYFNVPAW